MSTQMAEPNLTSDGVTAFLIETFRTYQPDPAQPLSPETAIETVGIDSFDFVEILFRIEDHYAVDLGYNANIKFSALTTVKDLADHIVTVTTRKIAA